ncbi:MAG: aminoacyl-tRNA hydrolase, partial [Clostridia bacterium]|nr:aminoacyl-tRNA hydrolase [Clostridia bacterium]
ACLGNPGREYERTRHNAGFMCAEYLSEKHNVTVDRGRFKSLCGDFYFGEKRALLIKPQTYMNLSGEAVREAIDFYKLDPSKQLLVVYDDIYLDVGKLRIRAKGSDGGHNGIKSISYQLSTDEFSRIRIGVGKPPVGWDMPSWVLGKIPENDQEKFFEALGRAAEAVEVIVKGDLQGAMNRYSK